MILYWHCKEKFFLSHSWELRGLTARDWCSKFVFVCLFICFSVSCGANRSTRSPELRMKIGEALVKATRICGELVPRYSQHLLPALLTGVKDPEPLVRASSLSNLGEVCQLLRFSLGPVVNEVGEMRTWNIMIECVRFPGTVAGKVFYFIVH